MANGDKEVIPFGKHKGNTHRYVVDTDSSYCTWALNQDNPSGALGKFTDYLRSLPQFDDNTNAATQSRQLFCCPHSDDQMSPVKPIVLLSPPHYSRSPAPAEAAAPPATSSPRVTGSFSSSPAAVLGRLTNTSSPNHIISTTPTGGRTGVDELVDVVEADDDELLLRQRSITPTLTTVNSALQRKVYLEEEVALELTSSDTFRIVVRPPRKSGYNRWTTFLPRDLFMMVARHAPVPTPLAFSADDYEKIRTLIQTSFECELQPIPDFILRAFPSFSRHASPASYRKKTAQILQGETSPSTLKRRPEILDRLGDELKKELKPFQVKGIEYGLKKNGRVLVGDEMGLGKTLEALAIASYYSEEWPLLIVCPSSIRFQWRDQVLRWLMHKVDPSQVFIVKSGRTDLPFGTLVVVISYEMLAKNEKFQMNYKVIICDESHYLKNRTAKRTQTLLPMLKDSRRAILLSGTPALNKPAELYPQVSSLLPDICYYDDFAKRYCELQMNPFSHRMEYVNYQHPEELNLFLTHTIMIRRLKKDVQIELPPKIRSKVPIEVSDKDMRELRRRMEQLDFQGSVLPGEEADEPEEGKSNVDSDSKRKLSRSGVTEMFTLTAEVKKKGACDYVAYLIDENVKFLVFAHHRLMMDALEDQVKRSKVDYIRIDGSTSLDKRESLVKRFQDTPNCQVGIMSITACGHGLNLTAAGTVVFAELYWVPGQMIQAEDRCHRIGTTHSTIDIHYLIAESTLDDTVWKTLNKKWSAMTSTLNGLAEGLDANQMAKSKTGSPSIIEQLNAFKAAAAAAAANQASDEAEQPTTASASSSNVTVSEDACAHIGSRIKKSRILEDLENDGDFLPPQKKSQIDIFD